MKLDFDIKTKGLQLDFDFGDKVTIDMGNKIFKPLTVVQNGTYEGGIEDGKQVGYTPVVVDVPLPVEPLTVTENGVYEAEEGKGFNIVSVEVKFDKSAVVKEIIALRRGNAERLFGYTIGLTNETLDELLKYDTTENAINLNRFFEGVFSKNYSPLADIPLLDTRKATTFQYFADYCDKAKIIPAFDLRSGVDLTSIFRYARIATEIWIKNIKANIQVGRGSDWGHLLTQESALSLCFQCRNTGSTKTITFAAPVFDNLATLYVKYVDITDEMRADDDLIDEKYPFVLCESTDEGAMTIATYMTNKMWAIARG